MRNNTLQQKSFISVHQWAIYEVFHPINVFADGSSSQYHRTCQVVLDTHIYILIFTGFAIPNITDELLRRLVELRIYNTQANVFNLSIYFRLHSNVKFNDFIEISNSCLLESFSRKCHQMGKDSKSYLS